MGCFQESQNCWACFPTSQPSPPCSRGLTRPPGPPSASARLQLLLCTEEGQETGRRWALWLLSKVLPSSPGRVGFYRGLALLSCLGFRVYPSFAAATPPSPPRPGPSTSHCSAQLLPGTKPHAPGHHGGCQLKQVPSFSLHAAHRIPFCQGSIHLLSFLQ